MPMKRHVKRMPGAKPVKNNAKDSQILQPSRQVRKMKKNERIMMNKDMMLMSLYRLMLLVDRKGVSRAMVEYSVQEIGNHTV